ncbi:Transforming growth factor beta regulator 1 [Mycena venus]|uniref:Transforming growth factor beta regulator 1 n=1 Tax=Mycena venus TaxID=2733690 RepID=A0A8H6YW21_9AGAR|nr:Transforming growth factor beta regulator 1 [Mycena venus]
MATVCLPSPSPPTRPPSTSAQGMSELDRNAQEAPTTSTIDFASSSGSGMTPSPKSKDAKDAQEIYEKYRKLKRRFFELEEKHKETSTELQRSGERNEKMREERNLLLERIIELESQPGFIADGAKLTGNTSPSGAFPRSLMDARARTLFTANLGGDAAAEEDDMDADAEIDPALMAPDATAHDLSRRASGSNGHDASDYNAGGDSAAAPGDSPIMVSSTGTRLRIRPTGGEDPSADPVASPLIEGRSISPDSGGMPVDDENDDSGDYSPPQKGTKRKVDSADYNGDALVAVAPEPKAPRRSSRRAAAATATPPSTSRSRIIQTARRSTGGKAAPAPPDTAAEQGAAQAAPSESPAPTNGHNTQNDNATPTASSSSSASPASRPGNLAFNPYLGYLTPNAHAMPAAAYNPYMGMYMGVPMPGAPMAYMPPPNFAPPPPQPPPQQQQRPPAEAPRAAKPKRLKAHTVTSKSYSIPMVPRDKKGKPMLPLNVGIMTVINLGDVCMREHFHTERYIFPVGYEVTRRYLSTIDATAEVVYHCTILDGGDGPKFQIIPSDVPDRPVIAGTATGAWSSIVKTANALRQRQHSNSELPNADRLRDYVWQHFVEGGPLGGRHAAVIPALPEEYDEKMLTGPYYPPRPRVQMEQQQREGPRQQQQQIHQQQPHAGPSNGGGAPNYYLPHAQQPNPPPNENGNGNGTGPTYAPSPSPSNGNNGAGSSFASIMNAFPTQGHENGGGGGEGIVS